jgi:glycosyltransferase involved in cell wall biosynthesis
MTVYINGKFLAQRATGVQRSAREWVLALDALLAKGPQAPGAWVLLHPPGAVAPALRTICARATGPSAWPLHAWEQFSLPWAARGGLLLNLAGSAPWFARAQVVTLHDAAVFDVPQAYTLAFRSWYCVLFRHLSRSTRAVLTVSEFSRQRLADCLQLDARRIQLVPNGADHLDGSPDDGRILDRLGLAPGRFFLAVASANPSKNLARLVEAQQRCRVQTGLPLVIAGGGNPRVFASSAVSEGEGVVQAGVVTDAELKALYRHALALVLPSLYEGFGLPAVEAMRQGCVVIAARAGSLPEVCGAAALYVDPLSVADIAAAMQRLAAEPTLASQLRQAGSRRASAMTWHRSAVVLRELISREAPA